MLKRNGLSMSAAIFISLPMLISTVCGSCSPAESELGIFAAAGAKPPIDEICQNFSEQRGIKVEINYGGGGEVLSQMMLSGSGDVYIAPEQRFMEIAVEKEVIDPDTIRVLAYVVPVIAVAKGNPKNLITLSDLTRPGIRVAVTRAETTLLGKYAPEIFKKAGLAEAIGNNIVAEAARPDSLLTMLVMGQVDAGIIWHFYEAQMPDDIETIFLPPEQLTGIGEMQTAVSVFSRDEKSAQRFVDFMTSTDGKTIFRKLGYFVEAEEVQQYWQ